MITLGHCERSEAIQLRTLPHAELAEAGLPRRLRLLAMTSLAGLAVAGCSSKSELAPPLFTSTLLALGTHSEMASLKEPSSSCDVVWDRVDPLDSERGVFVTYNATDQQNDCVRRWIRENRPELEATQARYRQMGLIPPE